MSIPCDKEEFLRDIHSDIKVILQQLKTVNGNMNDFKEHKKEGDEVFRPMILRHDDLLKAIKEEKLNSIKQAQWRIALIAGLPGAILAGFKMIEIIVKWFR